MIENKKQIDCCITMFELLKTLLNDEATFAQLTQILTNEDFSIPPETRIISVSLNKHLNTLKLFGLNINKEKGKYYLENSPFNIICTNKELRALALITSWANQLNNANNTNEEFNKFIHLIKTRLPQESKNALKEIESSLHTELIHYPQTEADLIKNCAKYCNEDFSIEITFHKTKKKIEQKITAIAQELLFRKNKTHLRALDLKSRQFTTIPLRNIISIKQLPTKINSTFSTNKITVMALRGRLARNYKLRPWEYVETKNKEWLIVVNKDESEEELTKRILKYGDLCKVITPLKMRQKIKNTIDETLALYS